MFKMRMTPKTKRSLRLVEELPDRIAALLDIMMHDLAQKTLEDVRDGIPNEEDLDPYRKSLRVRRVIGMKNKAPTWLLYAKPPRKRIIEAQPESEVIYIRARDRLRGRTPEFVNVLATFSPWTADTIPIYPTNREAVVYTRRVSKKEYQYVAESRRREKTKWGVLLARAGIPAGRRLDRRDARDVIATEDVAFTAWRVEFGGGGRRAAPHWRPAVKQFYRARFKQYFKRQRKWRRVLTDPNYRKWRKPLRGGKVPVSRLKRYVEFQRSIRERL